MDGTGMPRGDVAVVGMAAFFAAVVSRLLTLAWACGLRRIAPWSMPGRFTS